MFRNVKGLSAPGLSGWEFEPVRISKRLTAPKQAVNFAPGPREWGM